MKRTGLIQKIIEGRLTPEEKRIRDAKRRGLRTKRSVFHFEIRND